MGDALRKEATGIELVVPFRHLNFDVKSSVPVPGKNQPVIFKKQGDFIATDQSYFTLFSYEWLAGSRERALAAAAVLAQESPAFKQRWATIASGLPK